MTKQEKIKRWLEDNGFLTPKSALIFRYGNGCVGNYDDQPISGVVSLLGRYDETPIGLITPENKWIPAPKFEDDIEAPVALPTQPRGLLFEPDKFVPDSIRNVLLQYYSLVFTGYFDKKHGWHIFTHNGMVAELKDTFRARQPFTWEEL